MPSTDLILIDPYCNDPICNGLREVVNGLDPANVLAVFRAVIAGVTFEFIKATALLEHHVCEFYDREHHISQREAEIREQKALSLFMSNFSTWVREHPEQFALIVSGIILVTFASLSSTILAAVGFGPAGPVAQSIAAGIQSSIGSVPAGSAFAILQSASMGGQAQAIFHLVRIFGAAMSIWGVVPAVEQVIHGIPDEIPELQLGEKAVVVRLEENFAQFGLEIAKIQPADKIAELQLEKKFAELSQRIAELHLGRMIAELHLEKKFAELGQTLKELKLSDKFDNLRLEQKFAGLGAHLAGLHLDAVAVDVGRYFHRAWKLLKGVLFGNNE